MRGAAKLGLITGINLIISTHAPHARRGGFNLFDTLLCNNFYSRASCEARRYVNWNNRIPRQFLLTRLMRGAAAFAREQMKFNAISTHAPHARRGPDLH